MIFFENTSHQSFHDLILGDSVYIDKTAQILTMYQNRGKFEILVRPWGFGKTILLDTIGFIFRHGAGHAFLQHLNIASSGYSFPEEIVIKIDLDDRKISSPASFRAFMLSLYKALLFEHSVTYRLSRDLSTYWLTVHFIREISRASGNRKIVLLIDNYDRPFFAWLAGKIENFPGLYAEMLDFYHAVYDSGDYIDWFLVCGESKFALSTEKHEGIPYLSDISYTDQTSCLCGFSAGEIRKSYEDIIPDAAESRGETASMFLGKIAEWYGGYRFTPHNIPVARPYSIKTYFQKSATEEQMKPVYPAARLAGFLPRLLAKAGRAHEKFLAPNDCGYSFADSINPFAVSLFPLLSQLGFYSFNSIAPAEGLSFGRYNYGSTMVNHEMNSCYLQLWEAAEKLGARIRR